MTVAEIAAYFKVNQGTVYNLANAGKLPAIMLGKQWRFKKSDTDRLFEKADGRRRHPVSLLCDDASGSSMNGGREHELVLEPM